MDIKGNRIFAVDFDGTLSVGEEWPEIGALNVPLIRYLQDQKKKGARLILWTCRNGKDLKAAVECCKRAGLDFDTVNENLPELIELYGGDTRKINADVYIDDKAINPFPPAWVEEIAKDAAAYADNGALQPAT